MSTCKYAIQNTKAGTGYIRVKHTLVLFFNILHCETNFTVVIGTTVIFTLHGHLLIPLR